MARSPKTASRHRAFMSQALELAGQAAEEGEVPVGALVVNPQGEVVASAYNTREASKDPTAHAEMLALREAGRAGQRWSLEGHTLYVTLEPCPMCAGACVNARIERVVFGCRDPKAGAVRSLYALLEDPRLNHRVDVTSGVLEDECSQVLKSFFSRLRNHLT